MFVVKLYFSRVHGRLSKTKAMEPLRHPRAISQTRDLERFQILCGHVPLGPLVPTDLLIISSTYLQQPNLWRSEFSNKVQHELVPEGAAELQAI